jgi:hypothetical protein
MSRFDRIHLCIIVSLGILTCLIGAVTIGVPVYLTLYGAK